MALEILWFVICFMIQLCKRGQAQVNCFSTAKFSEVYTENDLLYLKWTHNCASHCNCTHSRLLIRNCENTETVLYNFSLPINCNITRVALYNEDVVIKIDTCSSDQCYEREPVGSCNENTLRINTINNADRINVRIPSQLYCFDFSLNDTCMNASCPSSLLINGQKHTILQNKSINGTSSIGYNNLSFALCIFNATEAEREFGTVISLQEVARAPIGSCGVSVDCHSERRGGNYIALLGNDSAVPESLIPSECTAPTMMIISSSVLLPLSSNSYGTTSSMVGLSSPSSATLPPLTTIYSSPTSYSSVLPSVTIPPSQRPTNDSELSKRVKVIIGIVIGIVIGLIVVVLIPLSIIIAAIYWKTGYICCYKTGKRKKWAPDTSEQEMKNK